MDTTQRPRKRANYRKQLDAPLAPVQRKIAASLAIADSVQEVARLSGANTGTVYEAHENSGIMAPSVAAMVKKQKILDSMLVVLDDIISKDAETALKYSDKLKAIELKAQLTGVLDTAKSETTNNTLVLDLRHATEEELLQELAKLEDSRRNVIDVVPQIDA